MKDKKKLGLIIATVILLISVILCFTLFNKKPDGSNKKNEFDLANLHNMVPMVQRANSGLYTYGYTEVNDKTTEELVIGALNHYEYLNCSKEETKNNCDTIDSKTIIDEINKIYGKSITNDDIEKVETKDNSGIHFYVYANANEFQEYIYKDGSFSVNGEKGYVNKNNEIIKSEKKDDTYVLYEKIYYLTNEYKDGELYQVLYSDIGYEKEVAREKIDQENINESRGIDLSKYSDYGVTYIHTFKKDGDNGYKYISSTVEGIEKPEIEEPTEEVIEEVNK